MDQKAFVILFVIVTIIAVAGLGVSEMFKSAINIATASPSPTPGGNLFGSQQQDANSLFTPQSQQILGQQSQGLSQQQQQQQSPVQQQNQRQIKQYKGFPPLSEDQLKGKKAVIQTNKGSIEFEIYADVPKAAASFIFLSSEKFFDGLIFHRVEPGFVIQGGDPLGNGTGGPGYRFEDEPVTRKYDKGIVAMANSGPNTNGSQFFIMLDDNPSLPAKYTIFGKVIKGQEVVDNIKVGDVMQKVSIESIPVAGP